MEVSLFSGGDCSPLAIVCAALNVETQDTVILKFFHR